MQTNAKRKPRNKFFSNLFYYILALLLGIVIGVLLCNWSYFTFDKQIKVPDLVTLIISAGVAIYVGNNIQKALTRRANDHQLLFDEVKKILGFLELLEGWMEVRRIPFMDSLKFFRRGSLLILSCKKIFEENDVCDEKDFINALSDFNNLKQEITGISPENGFIILTNEQQTYFDEKYREIRKELLQILMK